MVLVPGFSQDYYLDEDGNMYYRLKGTVIDDKSGKLVYLRKNEDKGTSTYKLIDIVAAATRPELLRRPVSLICLDGDSTNTRPENIGWGTLRTSYTPFQEYLIKVFNIPTDEFTLSDEEFEEEYNKWRPWILEEIRYYGGRSREAIDYRESYVAALLYRYMKFGIWENVQYKKTYLEKMCKHSAAEYIESLYGDKAYAEVADRVITAAVKGKHPTDFQQGLIDNSYTEETDTAFFIDDELKKRMPEEHYHIITMLQNGYKLKEIYEHHNEEEVNAAVEEAKNIVAQINE